MIVLGIIDSKPSSAALLIDNQIVAALAEERLCRLKMAGGMPRLAIRKIMEETGVSSNDIDCVAVAQRASIFQPEPIPWSGWVNGAEKLKMNRFERMSSMLAPLIGHIPLAWKAHHQIKRLACRERLRKIPALLREAYDINAPVKFYDHHYCHATSAYYTSNFDRALVVTLDGGGDSLSGSVYVGTDGYLKPVCSIDSFNSLGNFYSYITHLCGFNAQKDEGKITGLASLGEPKYADILRRFISYEDPGQIRYTIPMYHLSALRLISDRLPSNFDPADLAASVQLVTEEIGRAFIRYWLRRSGLSNIAVAGGVFANVKFNQRIHELDGLKNFFVHPAMDDSGLSVGSALAAIIEFSGNDPMTFSHRLPNVYLGSAFHEKEVDSAIKNSSFEAKYDNKIHESIANLLAQGYVVARFTGRMEYGPRALGHRSILYQTTDTSVNDWLNKNLNRTEFMPFAPATLAEHANSCYEGLRGAEDSARFMTVTFNCTSGMKTKSPGVVHIDGTARPQIADPETSQDLYKILSAYYRISGIPSLINTSFNMHEEAIVCTPEDALRSFKNGGLDYLAIGNWLISNPAATSRREKVIVKQ